MKTPAVSVVTPFTNQAAYIGQAIVSVQAQTFGDWELVLVDDGSTDGSRAVAERAAAADPVRVRVVATTARGGAAPRGDDAAARGGATPRDDVTLRDHAAPRDDATLRDHATPRDDATLRNHATPRDAALRDAAPRGGGAAAARNHGMRAARGALVAFLDADDVFLPAKLSDGVAVMAQHPEVALLYAPTRWWYDGVPGRDWVERPGVATDRVHAPPALLTRVLLQQRGDIPCTCGVLLRRSAAVALGGFEERFALYEDQSLWAKLLLAHPAYVMSMCHARYRQHPASTSAQAAARGDYDRYRGHAAQDAFFAWLAEWAAAHGGDRTVLAAIARARAVARRPLAGRLHLLAAQTIRRFVASRLS